MAAIVASAEIARSPDDVFAYVTDPMNLPEWQESVVKVECEETSVGVGTSAQLTRRVGKREMTMTSEVVELTPPTHWVIRGVDSPVRGNVDGRIEPLDNGARSRVTIESTCRDTASGNCSFRSLSSGRWRGRCRATCSTSRTTSSRLRRSATILLCPVQRDPRTRNGARPTAVGVIKIPSLDSGLSPPMLRGVAIPARLRRTI